MNIFFSNTLNSVQLYQSTGNLNSNITNTAITLDDLINKKNSTEVEVEDFFTKNPTICVNPYPFLPTGTKYLDKRSILIEQTAKTPLYKAMWKETPCIPLIRELLLRGSTYTTLLKGMLTISDLEEIVSKPLLVNEQVLFALLDTRQNDIHLEYLEKVATDYNTNKEKKSKINFNAVVDFASNYVDLPITLKPLPPIVGKILIEYKKFTESRKTIVDQALIAMPKEVVHIINDY